MPVQPVQQNAIKKLVKDNWRITTTEEVLIETGNGLAGLKWRKIAHKWIVTIRQSSSIFRVIPVTTEILDRSIELYGARMDKEWSLTDCISFTVMKDCNLTKALTIDHHFVQAGFEILIDV